MFIIQISTTNSLKPYHLLSRPSKIITHPTSSAWEIRSNKILKIILTIKLQHLFHYNS